MADPWYSIAETFDETEPTSAPASRELVPDGLHELEIVKVEAMDDRLSLRLKHDDKRYSFVFLDFYKSGTDGSPSKKSPMRMARLAAALGLTADEWRDAIGSGSLVGMRFTAECRSWISAAGKEKVSVDKFFPAAVTPVKPSAPPAARTPAAKVRAASPDIGNDDIPF